MAKLSITNAYRLIKQGICFIHSKSNHDYFSGALFQAVCELGYRKNCLEQLQVGVNSIEIASNY
jgi:hypothetical protein